MKTPRQILIDARKLIEREENWAQEAGAKNAVGAPSQVSSADATRFCSWGALKKCAGGGVGMEDALHILNKVAIENGYRGAIHFNDTHTHPEVLAMFDTAIAAAAEGEATARAALSKAGQQ